MVIVIKGVDPTEDVGTIVTFLSESGEIDEWPQSQTVDFINAIVTNSGSPDDLVTACANFDVEVVID